VFSKEEKGKEKIEEINTRHKRLLLSSEVKTVEKEKQEKQEKQQEEEQGDNGPVYCQYGDKKIRLVVPPYNNDFNAPLYGAMVQVGFRSMYDSPSLTDLVLIVGSDKIRVHKLVLSVWSTRFAQLIEIANINKNKEGENIKKKRKRKLMMMMKKKKWRR